MLETTTDTKPAITTHSVIAQYPSSAIGPLLCDQVNEYELEEHGSFWFFNNNPGGGEHYLRCVVWRDEKTGKIVGHNFDYMRSNGSSWWVDDGDSVDTVEEAVERMWYGWTDQAQKAATKFLANEYPRLIDGTLELHEVNEIE